MNSALRTCLLLAIASTGIAAEAKPLERCVLTLEARPSDVATSREAPHGDRFSKRHCPLAVVYPDREASAMASRNPRDPRLASPLASDDDAGPDDPLHRSLLHV